MGKASRRKREKKARGPGKGPEAGKRSLRDMLPPDWEILAVILFLALALRMVYAFSYDSTLYDQGGEGVRFMGQIRGAEIDTASPPLYILFLRMALGLFTRNAATAVFVIKGIAGTVSVGLLYYIASEISSRRTALISAAIMAVWINHMMTALALSPRVPGILALFTVTFVLIRGGRSVRSSVIAGALLGTGIMIDPYLLLFVPGLVLVSERRKAFSAALIAVVLPWTLRNSAQEGLPVPVYHPRALELDLSRFAVSEAKDFYHLVDRIYTSAAQLVSRGSGWVERGSYVSSESIRTSTLFGAYMYVLTALFGIAGALRYRAVKHRALLYPALIFLGLIILLSTCRTTNRLLAEHIAIFYLAVLIDRVIARFRAEDVSEDPSAGLPAE